MREILAEGTSAHVQLALYRGRRAKGDTPFAALQFVVDWLAAATVTDAITGARPAATAPARAAQVDAQPVG